ncbi:methylamine utilization protein [Litoribacillus peritrichatus]|uniref:methylamine utilization protein n=1 Tax=Litoribacillus peritrichatus TaxID=718191 RepID=UPI0031DA7DCE
MILWFPFPVFAYQIQVVDQDGNPVQDAVVAIPVGEVADVSPQNAVMDQIDRMFVPRVLAVEQGRKVVFPNSDHIRHHVYSFSESKRFEIKLYKGVPTAPVTFDKDGLVVLGCNIHDSMIGYIFVSPWPSFKVTGQSGAVEFTSGHSQVAVWHPWVKDLKKPLMFDLKNEGNDRFYQISLELTPPKPVKNIKNKFRKYYNERR